MLLHFQHRSSSLQSQPTRMEESWRYATTPSCFLLLTCVSAYVYNWTVTRPAGGSLYVVTGTHYVNKNVTWIPGNLGVPDYYYKVICDGKFSAGFLAKNVLASSGADAYDFRTVKSIQDLTGIDFGYVSSRTSFPFLTFELIVWFRWSSKCNIGAVNRSYWGW